MENKDVSPLIGRIDLEVRPEFNVVLAYDEIAGGMRAKECFDDLTRLHGELFKFNCPLWNFEVMRKPELFEAKAQDATKAEMMVIATRRSEAISGEAKTWIENRVRSKKANSCAILVLLSGKAAATGSARGTSLGKMAEQWGDYVFVQRSSLAGDELAVHGTNRECDAAWGATTARVSGTVDPF